MITLSFLEFFQDDYDDELDKGYHEIFEGPKR